MNSFKKFKVLFLISILFMFGASVTILFMSLGTKNQDAVVVIGCFFWILSIIGYVLIGLANIERKRLIKKIYKSDSPKKSLPGFISFFENPVAKIADITMITSFLIFLIIGFTNLKFHYIAYVVIFVFYFSLHMHSVFNGKNYKFFKNKGLRSEL